MAAASTVIGTPYYMSPEVGRHSCTLWQRQPHTAPAAPCNPRARVAWNLVDLRAHHRHSPFPLVGMPEPALLIQIGRVGAGLHPLRDVCIATGECPGLQNRGDLSHDGLGHL